MKKVLSLLLAVLMLLSFAGCTKPEEPENLDALARIKKQGYITIATEGTWAPWTYHDESGELVGIDIELGKLIAAKLGVEARFEETQWDAILAGIDAGRFDIACNGVGKTETRAEKYNFSDPYVFTNKVLIVRKDNTEINSFEDINGKKNANTASSTYAAVAESYGATNENVDSLTETITLLLQGRVDCTINSEMTINDYLKQHPDANIKVVDYLPGDDVCIPVKKNDDAASLLAAINKALAEIKASGELAGLSVKYFGGDYTEKK